MRLEKGPAKQKTKLETRRKVEAEGPNPNISTVEDGEAAWEAAEMFDSLKFDNRMRDIWNEYSNDPRTFFLPEAQTKLASLPSGERIVLLAHAARHLTVTPSLALRHFDAFPEDERAVCDVILKHDGIAQDGMTHSLYGLVWGLVRDKVHGDSLRGSRRSRGQYDEIAVRRELAPDFLLSNHQEGGQSLKEKFGKAAANYSKTVNHAHELSMHGDEILDTSKLFSNPAYQQLPSENRAEMLRLCLDDMQFALVFDETFNSVFTKESVERDNQRAQEMDYRHNPSHSMLFGTVQGKSVYELSQAFFEREMNNTAEIGGDVEEYPYHRILLAILKEFQHVPADADVNTDLLVEFWNKNRNPIFSNAVSDALSKQNPRRAAHELIEIIRSPETKNKQAIASILYRLELGQIGISDKGVRYLDRLYDLGEHNNPDFFVNRLTAKGDVGVFDEERKLVGYFKLGDLAAPDTHSRAEVLKLTYDMLFRKREAANGDEVLLREELMHEFTREYFSFYNDQLFDKTGVRFNNLDWREQGWFLHFMHGADDGIKDRATKFVGKYGEDGLRTFLSLEYDRNMGEKILEFAESDTGVIEKEAVFGLYSRLVSVAGLDEEAAAIAERMGKSARDVLEKAYKSKDDPQKVRQLLADVSVQGQILLATFRALREKGLITSVEEAPGVEYRVDDGVRLSRNKREVEALSAIYRRNQEPITGEVLAKKFTGDLTFPGASVPRIRFRDKDIGFMLVVPTGDKRMHVSALNVDPELVGTKAGIFLLGKVLELVSAGNIVEAEATPERAQQYIEQYGFIKVGEFDDPLDGAHLFKLELRPPESMRAATDVQRESDEQRK